MKFSVVIPVYNKASTVKRAFDSVLAQTYKDYEIVAVDDGSKDDSLSVMKSYSDLENISIIHQRNQGVSVARNVGIENSKGECITFLDPDDEWKPNHLEILDKVYNECNEIDALYATLYTPVMLDGTRVSFRKEVDEKLLMGKEYIVEKDIFSQYNSFSQALVHTNSVMIPKRVFSVTGMFIPGCVRAQDVDMWYRVMAQYPTVIIGTETTVYHKEDSTINITRSLNLDWPFFDTADCLIKEGKVKEELISSLNNFTDDLKLTKSTHMIMMKQKKKAYRLLKSIKNKRRNRMKVIRAYCLLCVPSSLLFKAYSIKHKNWVKS